MRTFLSWLCCLFSITAMAEKLTVVPKNYPGSSIVAICNNYETMGFDTLVNWQKKAEPNLSNTVTIPRNGFYIFLIGKLNIPVFLEKGTDYLIELDYNLYPANFRVNKKETFQRLVHTLNADWQYTPEKKEAGEQFVLIQTFDTEHQALILQQKDLSKREQAVLRHLLMGIVSIMKTNMAAMAGSAGLRDSLTRHFTTLTFNAPLYYEVFPEKLTRSMVYNSYLRKYGESPDQNPEKYFTYVHAVVPDKKIADFLCAYQVAGQIRYVGKEQADSLLNMLKTAVSSDQLIQAVAKKITVSKARPGGYTVPDMALISKSKSQVRLQQFAGKILLIDVWALWCSPCMAEKPALDSLEFAYKRSPELLVLRVSIDQDEAQWLKFVKKEKANDFWVEGGFRSEFCSAFNITAIPRFILVNEAGVVIQPDAPRPSGKALYALIDAELARMREAGKK